MTTDKDMRHEAEAEEAVKSMAQAFKDLAKGEQTAAAMESQLDALESKIDALLADVNNVSETLDKRTTDTQDRKA